MTPKQGKKAYIYKSVAIPKPPPNIRQKSLLLSKFIIGFAQMVICHGLDAIAFDASFFIFHC